MEAALASLERDGFVIVPNVLGPAEVAKVRARVEEHEAAHLFRMGRNNFEGEKTVRVYSLAQDTDVMMPLIAENPFVTELLDHLLLPSYLLSNLQSIRIFPGETLQPAHTDDAFYLGYLRPRKVMLGLSTIFALDDFTETNGATEIIPGSHKWGLEHPDDIPGGARYVKAIMSVGSVLIFNPATWHRGGANVGTTPRLALTAQYCQAWLRPQESQLLIVPPSLAAKMSPRGRSLVGYNIHPPFIGQVDGKHPERLIDESHYRNNKGMARKLADKVLEKPVATFIPETVRARM